MNLCCWCKEPVLAGEQALINQPMHVECCLRSVVGSVAHIEGRCSCSVPGSHENDDPKLSMREAAKAAAAAFKKTQEWERFRESIN